MMTTFASLAMPPMEEAMEMASPAGGQQYDGDIDIDFDDYQPANDDEHMLEDGDMPRPGTAATDDMMADVDHANVTSVPTIVEEEMQDSDDGTQAMEEQMKDEELIDYEDDMYPDDPTHADVNENLQVETHNAFQIQATDATKTEDHLPASDGSAYEQETQPAAIIAGSNEPAESNGEQEKQVEGEKSLTDVLQSTSAPYSVQSERPTDSDQAETLVQPISQSEPEHDAPPAGDDGENDGGVASTEPAAGEHDNQESPHHTQDDSVARATPPPLSIDASSTNAADAPATPTDRTLHAVSIDYGGYQWPLFKSGPDSEGLLKDDNLLNVSLSDLLHELRQRLAIKLDEDDAIPETRELVLNFDIFGLMVAESSLHASAASLNDVLGVYLKFQENDGISEHDAPPLFITLTTQLNFTSSMTSLKHLAATGAGLPAVEIEEEEYNQNFAHAEVAGNGEADLGTFQDVENDGGELEEDYQSAADDEGVEYHAETEEHAVVQEGNQRDDTEETSQDVQDQTEANEHQHDAEAKEDPQVFTETKDSSSQQLVQADSEDGSTARGVPASDRDFTEADPEFTEQHEESGVVASSNDQSEYAVDEISKVDATADEVEGDQQPDDSHELETENVDFLNDDYEQYEYDDPDEQDVHESAGTHGHAGDADHTLPTNENSQTEGLASGEESQPGIEETDDHLDAGFDLLDDNGNEPFDRDEDGTGTPHPDEASEHNDEDDIGFELDDDDNEAPAPTSTATSTPRHGKRSLETVTDEDHIDFDEPEPKKVRAD